MNLNNRLTEIVSKEMKEDNMLKY